MNIKKSKDERDFFNECFRNEFNEPGGEARPIGLSVGSYFIKGWVDRRGNRLEVNGNYKVFCGDKEISTKGFTTAILIDPDNLNGWVSLDEDEVGPLRQ